MFFQRQLLAILRAAHCRSTHHYFAVDALPMVQTDAGRRLVGHLLRHHERYLVGATDPDTRFRDFQNHVIHVNDDYWGGAPRVAHQWYDRMQRYLRNDRFSDAAHAAGVLSHYFTDPMQPLHTQQSESEKVLHRPIEFSITKSYDEILSCWRNDEMRVVFQLSDRVGWLGEAILHGARFANRKYDQLLQGYDLLHGTSDPTAGLDANLRDSIAELFGLAITGWARVLERAAADAETARQKPLPSASMSIPMGLATLRVPSRLWLRHVRDREEQTEIAHLLDEYARTGELREHIPAEVDIVHRVVQVYRTEKQWIQQRSANLATAHADSLAESRLSGAVEVPARATIPFVPRTSKAESPQSTSKVTAAAQSPRPGSVQSPRPESAQAPRRRSSQSPRRRSA